LLPYRRIVVLIRSLAVIAVIFAMLPLSLPTQVAAKKSWPACENFLNQDDAQAAYDADTSDPFSLVKAKQGTSVPCEGNATFGTQPLVSCDAVATDPNAQVALQGLLDHTAAGGDPYGLDPDGNGTACDQANGKGGDAETLDAPQSATPEDATNPTDTTSQPDTGKAKKTKNGGNSTTSTDTGTSTAPPPSDSSNDVTVIASTGGDESLGARLEARFAELEAQFAAFSGDEDTTSGGGQRSPVVVSTSPPATTLGGTSSLPSTTGSTATGTTTAQHRGHHHKGHGKGHGKHHKGKKHGKHHNKNGHKHH
jgi:hypothetical protein